MAFSADVVSGVFSAACVPTAKSRAVEIAASARGPAQDADGLDLLLHMIGFSCRSSFFDVLLSDNLDLADDLHDSLQMGDCLLRQLLAVETLHPAAQYQDALLALAGYLPESWMSGVLQAVLRGLPKCRCRGLHVPVLGQQETTL
jgi:hypothetical protein